MGEAADTVRAFYRAYRARDRDAAAALMRDDFTFTSPYDDAIGKAEYFLRCWEPGDRQSGFEIERVAEDGEGGVYLTYLATVDSGLSFRNTEHLVVTRGRIASVHVYFGESYRGHRMLKQVPPAG